jgi:DNA-binding FadR family transcriptional regulator
VDISAISGVSSLQHQSTTESTKLRQDYAALEKALKAGDMSAAQKAYAKIREDAPPPPPAGSDTGNQASSGTSNAKAQFDALGQALQSGDLAGAQKAFASIQASMKAHGNQDNHAAGSGTQQNVSNLGASLSIESQDADNVSDGSKSTVLSVSA